MKKSPRCPVAWLPCCLVLLGWILPAIFFYQFDQAMNAEMSPRWVSAILAAIWPLMFLGFIVWKCWPILLGTYLLLGAAGGVVSRYFEWAIEGEPFWVWPTLKRVLVFAFLWPVALSRALRSAEP